MPPPQSSGELRVDFESVFGTKAASSNSLDTDGKDNLVNIAKTSIH